MIEMIGEITAGDSSTKELTIFCQNGVYGAEIGQKVVLIDFDYYKKIKKQASFTEMLGAEDYQSQ